MTIYNDVERDNTIALGKKTLFVEGLYDWAIINDHFTSDFMHIHFGSNNSFNETNIDQWETIILSALKTKRWVTLEFDAKYLKTVLECGFTEYHNFIPKITVNLPYIGLLNYNAVLKIDDEKTESNPGTWTHHLTDLINQTKFTPGKM